jgi:hypothetical protein
VLLADVPIKIFDGFTGDTLLDGYLLQVAYMPSTLAGYPGMIQGYLDIPPQWARGIRNTIGSPFLNNLQAASNLGMQTTVWIFPSAPLFDGTTIVTKNFIIPLTFWMVFWKISGS